MPIPLIGSGDGYVGVPAVMEAIEAIYEYEVRVESPHEHQPSVWIDDIWCL